MAKSEKEKKCAVCRFCGCERIQFYGMQCTLLGGQTCHQMSHRGACSPASDKSAPQALVDGQLSWTVGVTTNK